MERTSPRSFILKVSCVLRKKSKILPWPTCSCGPDTWHTVRFSPPPCQERLILALNFGLGSFLLCVSHSGLQVEGAVAPGHALSLVTTSTWETKPNCKHTFNSLAHILSTQIHWPNSLTWPRPTSLYRGTHCAPRGGEWLVFIKQ